MNIKEKIKRLKESMNETIESRELQLYIENDGDLYRQRTVPIMKNLEKKYKMGTYDSEKAVKLWMYLVDDGAKKYDKDFGYKFNRQDKLEVAKGLRDDHEAEMESGNFQVEIKKESVEKTNTKDTFRNIEELKKYLRNGGKLLDVITVDDVVYTQDSYDRQGKEITFGNKKHNKGLILETEDRYKKGFYDVEIEIDNDPLLRNDMEYEESIKEDYEEAEYWKEVAKRELQEQLEVEVEEKDYGYYNDLGAVAFESVSGKANNGESEWIVFENEEAAERAAIEKVKEDLEDEPTLFSPHWLENHIYITDTDKRIIAGEEADYSVENMSDEDMCREADLGNEYDEITEKMDEFEFNSEEYKDLERKQNELVTQARDELISNKYDEVYNALKDPTKYFVEEQGIYSREDLLKQNFISIDYQEAAEDAVSTDGVAHFLDGYDGNEVELPSGAVAYGTN